MAVSDSLLNHPVDLSSPPFRVAITGGIGSGKTTIANEFARLGAHLIDTDLIAHQLTAAGGAAIGAIESLFGGKAIRSDGALDRAWMRDQIFQNHRAKKQLESILHPMIRLECEKQALAASAPYLIFVIPLLVESGNWVNRIHRILVVDCEVESQIQRVMQRNQLSRHQVEAILANQANRHQRLEVAHDVIFNEVPVDVLLPQIRQIHDKYLNAAHQLRS